MINPVGNKGPDESVRPGVTEEAAAAKKAASVQGEQKTPPKPTTQGDKVELSDFAREMQMIRARLGDQAAERAAKVEALRQKVEEGTYQEDTKEVAQRMYDSGVQG